MSTYPVRDDETVLRIYESGTFAGAMCNIRVDMSMNHGDASLLGLNGDWGGQVGPQLRTVGSKIRGLIT